MLILKFLLAVSVVASFTHSLHGQDEPFSALYDSKFVEQKKSIGQLIEMQIMDNELQLSRRWQVLLDREEVDETPESKLEAAIEKRVEQGWPEKRAREIVAREMKHAHEFGGEQNPVVAFMTKMHEALGGGGHSKSGGGERSRCRFRGHGQSMGALVEDGYVELDLTEEGLDGFDIKVVDSPEESVFLFRFSSLDEIVNLRQRKGEIKFSYIVGDEANVLTASSFNELLEKHPKPVNDYLIALWEELGVVAPLSLSNPEAMTAAITILDSIHDDEMQVFGLLEALGADSLSGREVAADELKSGLYKWRYWVDKLKGDFEYDKISQEYLSKVLKYAPATPAQDYASSLDFADVITLVQVLESANDEQKATVQEQLKLVTGEQREDVAAWKEYLSAITGE